MGSGHSPPPDKAPLDPPSSEDERAGGDGEATLGESDQTLSVGLAELQDDEGPQELIDRADRDLLASRGG